MEYWLYCTILSSLYILLVILRYTKYFEIRYWLYYIIWMCFIFPSLFVSFLSVRPEEGSSRRATDCSNGIRTTVYWRVKGSVVTERDYHYHCSNKRRISGGSILNILRNTKYSCWWIRLILWTTQYFWGVDTICTMQYVVFSGRAILSKSYKQYTLGIPVFIL